MNDLVREWKKGFAIGFVLGAASILAVFVALTRGVL